MKIVIAGAGLGGMSAAWRLAQHGHEVTILEASGRVGGRSWSEALPNGEYVERGGEFINPVDHSIRGLCAELELPLIPHGIVFDRRWMPDGNRMSVDELKGHIRKLYETIAEIVASGQTEVSLEAAAAQAFGNSYRENPMYIRLVTSLANDPSKVSAWATHHQVRGRSATSYIEHGARVLGGNNAVTLSIHKKLGDVVHLNTAISAVEQTSQGVVMTSTDGQEFVADFGIVAIPLPKLKSLAKDLELPELARAAIETREMGVAAKISIVARAEATPRGMQYPDALWWTWNSASPASDASWHVATGFAGGQGTIDDLNLQDGGTSWRDKVKSYRTDLDLTDDFLMTNWADQPFTGGAYSAPGLQWRPEFDGAFDTLHGRIAFAGEHTGTQSSLNGAVTTGLRAAQLINAMASTGK